MYNRALRFHFVGIGGSGMSGIAEVLLSSGFAVSGTDLKESDVTARLKHLGAVILTGHSAENLPSGTDLVVYSSAVRADNPELVEAKRRSIPVVRRAEVLAELMRLKYGVGVAGSHGKTSTTSMCGAILEEAGLDPTVIIGGQVVALGTGGKAGRGEYLVAETDESDRSFLMLKPTVAVVTNIDNEHLCAYKSMRDLQQSFESFVQSVPFYGLAVLCVDDPAVRRLATKIDRRVRTYGFSTKAEISAKKLCASPAGMDFVVTVRGEPLGAVHLPMLGRHFALNALGAIAVGLEFGIPFESIARALASFRGVRRRLEVCGEVGCVTVVNDYGHHPTEIRATIAALKDCLGQKMRRLIVLFQPHRYTRTRDSWEDFIPAFKGADRLLVTEMYAAGETPIEGRDAQALSEAIEHPDKSFCGPLHDTAKTALAEARPGDVLLCLGAGSIGQLPATLLAELAGSADSTPISQAV
jgi:UDP-N-acetylmuramate--alanine ligase